MTELEINNRIKEINDLIESKQYKKKIQAERLFGGADVIIEYSDTDRTKAFLKDQPVVIGMQETIPRRRVVLTKDANELSWVFFQLRDIFQKKIDYISKNDFFGLLAQSAIDFIKENNDKQTTEELLKTVLNTAKKMN